MSSNPKPSVLLPWLRLLRIPNLPSAIANVLMAFVLVNQLWEPRVELLFLILATTSLYLAGMILNDVFDFEIDSQQRPGRPLPAGEIRRETARQVGFGLLVIGVLFAVTAGWFANRGTPISFDSPLIRTGVIAIGLAILIFLYDGPLKRTRCAPLLMGGCRSLNVLLGASTFVGVVVLPGGPSDVNLVFGIPIIAWWASIAIGVLVAGTTLLGRNEASETQHRASLVLAGVMIAAGLIAIACIAYCPGSVQLTSHQQQMFLLFIGIISLTICRRVIEAIATAQPKAIQRGVVSVLRSLIIFDAALCYLATPGQYFYAMVVLSLLIPTLFLGRFIPST